MVGTLYRDKDGFITSGNALLAAMRDLIEKDGLTPGQVIKHMMSYTPVVGANGTIWLSEDEYYDILADTI